MMFPSDPATLEQRLETANALIRRLYERIHELENQRYGWVDTALRFTTCTAENDVPLQVRTMDIRIAPFRVSVPWASMQRSRKEREHDLRRCALRLTRHFMAALRSEIVG